MSMRAFRLTSLAGLLLVAPSAYAGKWQAIEHVPGHTPLTVTVNEKPRIYFRVSLDSPLVLTVEGPGRLKLVSRAELPRGGARSVSYRVRVVEKGKVLREQATESSAAAGAQSAQGDAILCKSRNAIVELPAGNHQLTVAVSGASSVLIRALYSSSKRGGEAMISITPVDAPRSVTVSEAQKLIPYYSVFQGKPVRLRIVGPTRLELSTRLDFDVTMRGVQPYRIAISTGGKRIRDVDLKTTKSATASYTDLKDRSASKLDRIVIPLGDGVHELSVELIEPKTGSAEVHARIPQPTVGSEE